jgi:hypothetical protein
VGVVVVQAYETKQGKRYRVRYRTPDNRQTDKRGLRTGYASFSAAWVPL